MKVLHLISSCGFFGAENVVIELSSNLRILDIDVVVGAINNTYNSHTEICDIAKSRNIPCVVFNCTRAIDFRAIFEIRSFLNKNDIDFAAWRREHPSKPVLFRIEDSKNVKKAVSDAVEAIQKDLDSLAKEVKKK